MHFFLRRVDWVKRLHWLDFCENCNRGDVVIGDPELGELQLQGLLVSVESHFEEGEGHGEDHPDVDHLHIRCRWQSARYTDEAERMFNYLIKILWTDYLQSGQDEKDRKVDHDDHVDVFLFVDIADVADGEEDDGRDEDGEDVADQRSPQADVHLHTLVVAD